MDVAWGGNTLAGLTASPSHDYYDLGWVVYTYMVTATQATTQLEFVNTTSFVGSAGPQIDAVSVSAVPEPSSLVMGFVGMAMLGGVGLARRRSAG